MLALPKQITMAVARIKKGLQKCLYLGNLNAKRDWGHARDYVKGMWMILQQDKPDDFVLATGETHSVREFVEKAFKAVDISVEWHGEDAEEYGCDAKDSSRVLVRVDPKYFRPTEVDLLIGDPAKAKRELNWEPEILFEQLVEEMVAADLADLGSSA
eukprot:scaffold251_cov230-Pinguiococcus_pyrenoidosus.AAC.2